MSNSGRSVADIVLHIAQVQGVERKSLPRSHDKAVEVLTGCLYGAHPTDVQRLAQAWLDAAQRAVSHSRPSPRDTRALELVAQAVRVPPSYFYDPQVADAVDAWIDQQHQGQPTREATTLLGPCRSSPELTAEVMTSVRPKLLRELAIRIDPS